MCFKLKKVEEEITCDELISQWECDSISKTELSVELEWLRNKQDNNDKYAIYDTNDDNYPMVYEITNVQNTYLKTLKIKHAPYMLDKFYESMNFGYLSNLYKQLIKNIIQQSNQKNINEFRIFIDNDNTIAILAFQLFAQLLLPNDYYSRFSSCKRWLFVEKK
jgi:hypothetical protein